MIRKKCRGVYLTPELKDLQVYVEKGFAVSDGFEQPEFGGEDNL